MKPRFTALATLAALALGLAAPAAEADVFRASNSLLVQSDNGVDIFVPYAPRALDNAYWCAAGDYVVIRQGRSGRTRLFRASEPPRKRGQGIVFTTDPARAAKNSGLTVFGSPDGTISAGQARSSFCHQDPIFGFP
ncbi:hypothetical protein [Oceaniglobus roseus]|uniref:hypothetical protein n=1 Tax=Oceaniglobus roseus TaxID=1737570 RepID=UPI000C7F750A|nr:hypothetical protein [Kandeliimicrobium roseum]